MRSFNALVSLSLLSLHSQPISAYWRMACSVSQTARIDPILDPGTVSGHVHKFAGGNNVNQFSTHESLLASTCSTCEVQDDKSAYWTPQLYYQHANGTIEEVQNEGMTVYYVGRGGNTSNTVPFPDGFRMISGNSISRHYDTQNLTYLNTRPIADRVSFRCINEANNIPETHYINDTNCVNGFRAQLNFQSCWDGVNLYSPGNTHVAYLSGIDYGVCPPSHPVPIPGLFFEVLYWTNLINQSGGGRFVFANGDTTGYGFHGDFMNGWKSAVQAQAVQQCLYSNNGNGDVLACPELAKSANANFPRTCPESPSVLSEVVTGVLPEKRLPGCNPITSGPPDAPQVVCAINSTTPITLSSPAASSAPSSISLVVTLKTSLSSSSMSSSSSTSSSKTTVTNTVSSTPTPTPSRSLTTSMRSTASISTTVLSTSQQSAGGIFVTVSSSATMIANTTSTVSITSAVPLPVVIYDSTEVLVIGTTTITTTVVRTSTLQWSAYCSMYPAATQSACISASTNATITSNTSTGTETLTVFVTVFSPVTVEVTATAISLAKIKRQEEPVTYRLRGRQIIQRRS